MKLAERAAITRSQPSAMLAPGASRDAVDGRDHRHRKARMRSASGL